MVGSRRNLNGVAGRLLDRPLLALLIATLLLWGTLTSCQTTPNAPTGKAATNQILLKPGGPHRGAFVTRDMTINYEFRVENDKLLISGSADIKYRDVDKLTMTLFYLDENGAVIDYYSFFARTRRAVKGSVMDNTFNREFDLPKGAAAFSIGYTGRTRTSHRSGGWVFRYTPFN